MNTMSTEISEGIFAERIMHVPRSFLREILKLTSSPGIISFAGGLPDPSCFPYKEIKLAAEKALTDNVSQTLQYSITEGYLPLREQIAEMYRRKFNMIINPSEVLITNGSQQGLDLLGKVLINPGDKISLENPSYLGAIQAFSLYQPKFIPIPLEYDGPSQRSLEAAVKAYKIKMMYAVPEFQNPTGYRWSPEIRRKTADILLKENILFIEDNPYGEITFNGESYLPMKALLGKQGILLGSFSKTISPGLRTGWIVADEKIIQKLVIAKQASDLHSNMLSQKLISFFLNSGDYERHLQKIKESYGRKKRCMREAIEEFFPEEVAAMDPEGGMFIWATLPYYIDSFELFKKCLEQSVAFVPGQTFYPDGGGLNTMRLNYSNSSEEDIRKGIAILGAIIKNHLKK